MIIFFSANASSTTTNFLVNDRKLSDRSDLTITNTTQHGCTHRKASIFTNSNNETCMCISNTLEKGQIVQIELTIISKAEKASLPKDDTVEVWSEDRDTKIFLLLCNHILLYLNPKVACLIILPLFLSSFFFCPDVKCTPFADMRKKSK